MYPLPDASNLIRKNSYISENNFGPSNQIIVPTSYSVYTHVFCMGLRINSDYLPIYDRDGVCLLRGTDWTFNYISS